MSRQTKRFCFWILILKNIKLAIYNVNKMKNHGRQIISKKYNLDKEFKAPRVGSASKMSYLMIKQAPLSISCNCIKRKLKLKLTINLRCQTNIT